MSRCGGSGRRWRAPFPRIPDPGENRGGFAAGSNARKRSLTDPQEEAIIGTEVGWKRGERKGRGGGRGGKKRKTLRRPCRDETRFQGIATRRHRDSSRPSCWRGLQGRDPLSGDCDPNRALRSEREVNACRDETRFQGIATWADGGEWPDFPAVEACRDETRFQGIATVTTRIGSRSRTSALAGTRPAFRGLRPRPPLHLPPQRFGRGLQGRDPLSGDCDSADPSAASDSIPRLAGTRPAFRGLRPLPRALAELLHVAEKACRDETRFQGIATDPRTRAVLREEVRLQGRDPFSGDCDTRYAP